LRVNFFGLSLFFHLLLVGFFFFRTPLPAPPKPIEVEILSSIPGKDSSSKSAGAGKANGSRQKIQLKSWSLSPGYPLSGPLPTVGKASDLAGNFAEKMDLKKEGQFFRFGSAIHKKIDSLLTYPSEFVEENIGGIVRVHFLVDGKGVFTGKILALDSDNDWIETYILVTLLYALKEPLDPSKWEKEEVPMAANFEFILRLPDEFRGIAPPANFKNNLNFMRVGFTNPKINKDYLRFYDRVIPGFVPLNGGLQVDFARAYRYFADRKSRTEEPRRKMRMEMQKDLWKLVIKRG
jgi:hypothetical protein